MGILIPNFEDTEGCASTGPAFLRVHLDFPLLTKGDQQRCQRLLKYRTWGRLRLWLKQNARGIAEAYGDVVDQRTLNLIDGVVFSDEEAEGMGWDVATRRYPWPWSAAQWPGESWPESVDDQEEPLP